MVLHPVPLVCWSGALMFSLNKMEAVLDAVNTLKSEERSSDTCGLLGIIRNAGGSNVSTLDLPLPMEPRIRI